MGKLYLRPWTVKKGKPFVHDVHRRLPKIQGAMWAVSLRLIATRQVVGCALVGHAARMLCRDDETLSVLRVAVMDGHPNGCSMLYGACSRMGKASGAENMVTYTHLDEPGTSLRAAGWVSDGITAGGEHGRPSRPRAPAVDASPKRRWWAPWSKRVVRADGLLPGLRDPEYPCGMFAPGTPTDGGCDGDGHYLLGPTMGRTKTKGVKQMKIYVEMDNTSDSIEDIRKILNVCKAASSDADETPKSSNTKLPDLPDPKGKKSGRGKSKKPTQAQVKDSLKKFIKKHGKDAAKNILAKYDALKISELEKENYQAVIDAFSKEPESDDDDDFFDDDED